MKSSRLITRICIVAGAMIFLWCATIMPRTTSQIFASPDETAVMLFANAWTPTMGFRMPHRLPEDLAHLVSLHPRSMVRQGVSLVPVGFLGMPFLAMVAERVMHGLAAYMTAILVLSSAYPLWQIARRMNAPVAWVTVFVYLTFPIVLLYANRGLFPNLPVVALGLWSIWSLLELRRMQHAVIAGVSLGLALTIRPIEAMWLLPWVVWAAWVGNRESSTVHRKKLFIGICTTAAVCLGGVLLAYQTYPGSHGLIPPIGYFLHDSTLETVPGSPFPVPVISPLPYGFHPRVMWHNVRTYLGSMLGPWFAAAFLGALVYVLRYREKRSRVFFALVGWTVGVLLLVYGQSVFLDNIRGGASLGNSFLRYMLPLTPIIAFGIAMLCQEVRAIPHRGRVLATCLIVFFTLYGVGVGLNYDEESILKTQHELVRYTEIRRLADESLEPGTVIFSERSDKIFASGDFITVSPLPSSDIVNAVVRSSSTVALFHRTLTEGAVPPAPLSSYIFSDVYSVDNESMVLVWH